MRGCRGRTIDRLTDRGLPGDRGGAPAVPPPYRRVIARPLRAARPLPRPFRVVATLVAVIALLGIGAPAADARMPQARAFRVGGPIGLDTNLLSSSGESAWAIDAYLAARTDLPPLGAAFIAAERRYGVNARFLLAAAMHESGWGSSAIARHKHNLFGFTAYDRSPMESATAWESFAAGIDYTAAFIRRQYLTEGGRFWTGQPTLRAMQIHWSSSGWWGTSVSRIATSMPLGDIAGRSVRFAPPAVRGLAHAGDRLAVTVDWAGPELPGGVSFAATWVPVALDADVAATGGAGGADGAAQGAGAAGQADAALARVTAPASGADADTDADTDTDTDADADAPTGHVVPRIRTASRGVVLGIEAPAAPGEYRLELSMLDAGGTPLPARQRAAIPSLDLHVWGEDAVAVSMAATPDGAGVTVTLTNTGRAAIPAVAQAPVPGSGPGSGPTAQPHLDAQAEQTVVSVTASAGPGGPVLASLLAIPLAADLAPGASVTYEVTGIDAATARTAAWLSVTMSVAGDPTRLAAYAPVGAWRWAGTLGPTVLLASADGSGWSAPSPGPAAGASTAPEPEPPVPPAPVTTAYNEHNPAITYTGTWADAPFPDYGGGNVAWSKTAGATASLTFTGTSVTWFGPKGPTRGRAAILVDGVEVARVSLWQGRFVPHVAIYRHTFATAGTHTITIRVLATPAHPTVAIDELRVRS